MTTSPSTRPSSFLRSQGEVRTLRISLYVAGNDPVAQYRTCPAFLPLSGPRTRPAFRTRSVRPSVSTPRRRWVSWSATGPRRDGGGCLGPCGRSEQKPIPFLQLTDQRSGMNGHGTPGPGVTVAGERPLRRARLTMEIWKFIKQ
jgi:hypothetical protein